MSFLNDLKSDQQTFRRRAKKTTSHALSATFSSANTPLYAFSLLDLLPVMLKHLSSFLNYFSINLLDEELNEDNPIIFLPYLITIIIFSIALGASTWAAFEQHIYQFLFVDHSKEEKINILLPPVELSRFQKAWKSFLSLSAIIGSLLKTAVTSAAVFSLVFLLSSKILSIIPNEMITKIISAALAFLVSIPASTSYFFAQLATLNKKKSPIEKKRQRTSKRLDVLAYGISSFYSFCNASLYWKNFIATCLGITKFFNASNDTVRIVKYGATGVSSTASFFLLLSGATSFQKINSDFLHDTFLPDPTLKTYDVPRSGFRKVFLKTSSGMAAIMKTAASIVSSYELVTDFLWLLSMLLDFTLELSIEEFEPYIATPITGVIILAYAFSQMALLYDKPEREWTEEEMEQLMQQRLTNMGNALGYGTLDEENDPEMGDIEMSPN